MNNTRRFSVLLALVFGLTIHNASYANDPVSDVRLVIENTADQPIRCIAIVAHFLTKDLGTIDVNSNQSVDFELYEDGGLAQGSFKGKVVFIENLRCGADVNWTKTSADIPLDLLREDGGTTVNAFCDIADKVTCRLEKGTR